MAKKKKLKSEQQIGEMYWEDLQTLIDDQIYRHLPIAKIEEMIKTGVKEAISVFDPKVNDTLHKRLLDLDLRIGVFEGYGKPKKGKAA